MHCPNKDAVILHMNSYSGISGFLCCPLVRKSIDYFEKWVEISNPCWDITEEYQHFQLWTLAHNHLFVTLSSFASHWAQNQRKVGDYEIKMRPISSGWKPTSSVKGCFRVCSIWLIIQSTVTPVHCFVLFIWLVSDCTLYSGLKIYHWTADGHQIRPTATAIMLVEEGDSTFIH